MQTYDFFADNQMKRFLAQIVKAFSGFQYRTGRTINGKPETLIAPCKMASQNRMVAHLIRNGSENTIQTVPMITVAQTGLAKNASQANGSIHVSSLHVAERAVDADGKYTGERGQTYTIERMIPRPFTMTVQVDIWTSNLEQKHQLLEQILVVTSTPFDIQNSDHAVDWAALTMMVMTDIAWSSRSVNIGSDDDIDVATLTFEMPFWLNPPAKVTRQTLIHQVNTTVSMGDDSGFGGGDYLREVVTYNDHRVAIQRGVITLLSNKGNETTPDGAVYPWVDYFAAHNEKLKPAITQLRLRKDLSDDKHDIIGVLQQGDSPNKLIWQIDPETLPSNTIDPINGIVKPLSTSPGNGLPDAANGQRYLVYEDIGSTAAWGALNAKSNDIIQFNNGSWSVVFEAARSTGAYVLNQSSGTQLRWTGSQWEKSIDGEYGPGHWRLFI